MRVDTSKGYISKPKARAGYKLESYYCECGCKKSYWRYVKSKKRLHSKDKLTFAEISIGDKFIAAPCHGDNRGHGGYKGEHYLFLKIGSGYSENAVLMFMGRVEDMPPTMEIIKIK